MQQKGRSEFGVRVVYVTLHAVSNVQGRNGCDTTIAQGMERDRAMSTIAAISALGKKSPSAIRALPDGGGKGVKPAAVAGAQRGGRAKRTGNGD